MYKKIPATRYLHEIIVLMLNDLLPAANLEIMSSGDTADFTLQEKLFLSYHPAKGYILEVKQKESQKHYFILGNNDFTIKITYLNRGALCMESSTKMIIEKCSPALNLYWLDKSQREYAYHCKFLKDNFVIETSGNCISTFISFEQEYHYLYSHHEGYTKGWS